MLVTNSLTHWLLFSKLDWCDSGMWRWQLKTCWSCYCCWGWWWETFDNTLVQIWKVKFGHKKFLFGLWGQGCWSCYCCSIAHVDDDNSLVQIRKVKFGHKVKFLFRLWAQGFKVWSRFWSWCSGKILKLKFGHYFATEAWLWLWSFVEMLVFDWDFEVGAWSSCQVSKDVWSRFV